MKLKKLLIPVLGFAMLTSCQTPFNQDKPLIVATLYPQYSLVDQLVGDIAEVKFLLNPGASSHSFEPTPSQVIMLNEADLILFSSENIESWIHSIEETAQGKLIDLSLGVNKIESDHNHDHEEDHEEETVYENEHDHGDYDPHYWLDPKNGTLMLHNIVDELISLMPSNASLITSRKNRIKSELEAIAEKYEQLVAPGDELDLVFGGHNAFGYLGNYHIHFKSPYVGFSDDVLPTADSIAKFIETMNQLNTKILFITSTDSNLVVDALRQQFNGLETKILSTAENVSKTELDSKVSYQDLLLLNYEIIEKYGR